MQSEPLPFHLLSGFARKMSEHAQLLLQHLRTLYQRHLLTDVVLLVEDRSFPAHAAVLVAYSKYFQGVLQNRAYPQTNELVLNSEIFSL